MSRKRKKQLQRAVMIFVLVVVASFIAQLLVQLFMGGVNDVMRALVRSLAIGMGMAVFIFIVPGSKEEKYPWQ